MSPTSFWDAFFFHIREQGALWYILMGLLYATPSQTALSWQRDLHYSMKLSAKLCKSSDKMWSTGGGNGNPLQYNPVDSMKRQNDMTEKDEHPRSECVWYATGKEQRSITNSYRNNEVAGPKWKWHLAADVSGGESKV